MVRRVVKIGGSLLVREDLAIAMSRWLSRQTEAETLIIVGGGAIIDAIRKWDKPLRLDPVNTHWRCVDLLRTTFEIVGDCFPVWQTIETVETLESAIRGGFDPVHPTLVAVATFYHPECDAKLPLDWRTTTDAIAAYLAIQSAADELVLLKSCDVPLAATIHDLVAEGIVDEALPMIASEVKKMRIETL